MLHINFFFSFSTPATAAPLHHTFLFIIISTTKQMGTHARTKKLPVNGLYW